MEDFKQKLNELENSFDKEIKLNALQNRFISEIDQLLNKQKKSHTWLANQMGISTSFISQLFNMNKRLNLEQIIKFQDIFNIQFKIDAVKSEELEYDYSKDLYITKQNIEDFDIGITDNSIKEKPIVISFTKGEFKKIG